MAAATYDLLVIGGGINGAGIARDAAGRGLSVLLAEKADLGAATSSASSKLIHGGLRYLEQYEFRLVAEALAEREILLGVAAHLTSPLRFVMPHVPELRPRWMVRLGLFLYDHLARRSLLPGSRRVRLDAQPWAEALRPGLTHGFLYSDCVVDDARLVLANALDAQTRGARLLVRTELLRAQREQGTWRAQLSNGEAVLARAIVNAAGPWVKRVLNERLGQIIATLESERLLGPDARVARCLAHLFNPLLYPHQSPKLAISQAELGFLTGLSRQRVNQALQTLERAGLLTVEYGSVTVASIDGLRTFEG